jgi:PTH1 family peptidyl-tRNA hydrolase
MKVVVGLGNPGAKYHGTRHNVGFAVIDLLALAPSAGRFSSKFNGDVAELSEAGEKVLLVKPQTFMNLSGRCVRQVVDFYKVAAEDLLVVCDDFNLSLGRLRMRTKGTHGGHNGLRDIQSHLGTTEYPRLRIGVGSPQDDTVDYVLGKFRPSERAQIEDALGRAVQAVALWIHQGAEPAMNQFNGGTLEEA